MDGTEWLFDSGQELVRVVVSALLIYPLVIAGVRLAGKRSTSQMNNFDWIVTVALGSIVGSTILFEAVSMAEAIVAIYVLLGLQYILTWGAVRSGLVARVVRAQPTLIFYDGEYITEALERERISRAEVEAVVRECGCSDLAHVWAVVMEPDTTLSVIPRSEGHGPLLENML